jgi:hypothetical protein
MKLFSKLFIAVTLIGGFSFLQSCNGDNSDQELKDVEAESEMDAEKEMKAEKVRQVLYSIPSPIETATLVKMSGVDFNSKSMNDPNKVGDYNTTKSQSFNLGVYGSDLAYSSIFERSQEALHYFSAVKLLSDELGVSSVINDENISRFERNIENRDSLMVFINEIFWAIDAGLVEDDRAYVSAIVMTGGWVEALYILMKNAKGATGEGLERVKQIVADQKYSLENILNLISAYNEDENLMILSSELQGIDMLFDRIIVQDTETSVTENADGKVILGGGPENVQISDELMEQIYAEVNKIRTKYVN